MAHRRRERPITAEARKILSVPVSIDAVIKTFRKWLHFPDPSALMVTLGAVAANLMPGDAVWLLLVGPTGSGKTEIIDSLLGLPHNMHPVGTLSEAALLSGSPRREMAKDASGGLLRLIGDFGFLILKDFTSILSTGKEIRGPLLAALREIHDGAWTRHIGTDGGRALPWKGKCALIGGSTPAIDTHHAVMAMMGERFIFYRMPEMDREKQADRAMQHVSQERKMRRELREAVSALFRSIHIEAQEFNEDSRRRMAALATFVAHARSDVERDSYHREIDLIPASEMPGRLARSLRSLFQGLKLIGVSNEECWRLVTQVGLDCIPEVRRKALELLFEQAVPIETSAVAEALAYPTSTARRTLEDLTGHQLVHRFAEDQGKSHRWQIASLSKELLYRAEVSLDRSRNRGDHSE
jgi:hypothetical protein